MALRLSHTFKGESGRCRTWYRRAPRGPRHEEQCCSGRRLRARARRVAPPPRSFATRPCRCSTIAATPRTRRRRPMTSCWGSSPSPPYSSLAPGSDKAEGLDVEINEAALKWAGITKIKYEVMPFGQLIPALLSKRIDAVSSNIHVTPDRLKAVSFTGPAWWYGPAIGARQGQSEGHQAIRGSQGQGDRCHRRVCGRRISAQARRRDHRFPDRRRKVAAISTGRVDAIVEDDVKVAEYIKRPTLPHRSRWWPMSVVRRTSSAAMATAMPATPCARRIAQFASRLHPGSGRDPRQRPWLAGS